MQMAAVAGERDEIDHSDRFKDTAPFGRGSEKRMIFGEFTTFMSRTRSAVAGRGCDGLS